MNEDPWKVHGYFFSICFGIFMVSLGSVCASFLSVPSGVPLKEVLTPLQGVLFVGLLGVCAAIAYLLARVASLALNFLIKAMRRKTK